MAGPAKRGFEEETSSSTQVATPHCPRDLSSRVSTSLLAKEPHLQGHQENDFAAFSSPFSSQALEKVISFSAKFKETCLPLKGYCTVHSFLNLNLIHTDVAGGPREGGPSRGSLLELCSGPISDFPGQLPRWCWEPTCQCRRPERRGFSPQVGKISWRRT